MLNNFIYAQTKELFLNALENHQILDEAIVFIEDTKEIWNHGHYFAGLQDLSGYVTDEQWQSIANQINSINTSLDTKATKDELTNYATTSSIPTNVSQLTNDKSYLTKTDTDKLYATTTQHTNLSNTVSQLNTTVAAKLSSEDAAKTYATKSELDNKQDPITDLATIRSGAALGATAVQPAGLNNINTSISNINTTIATLATKAELDSKLDSASAANTYVPVTRKINNVALDKDITITATDPNAATKDELSSLSSTVDTVKSDYLKKSDAAETYAKITDVPTNNNQLENGAGYITINDANNAYAEKALETTVANQGTAIAALQAVGAEANVQSDWNAKEGDAFIKNKPDLSVYLKSSDASNTYATQTTVSDLDTKVGGIETALDNYKTSVSETYLTKNDASTTYAKSDASYTKQESDGKYLTSDALTPYATDKELSALNTTVTTLSGTVSTNTETINDVSDRVEVIEDYFNGADDADNALNKWHEITDFLNSIAETDDLTSMLANKADKSALDTTNTTVATISGWGNHADAGYQSAINDLGTIRTNASNGATAHGWGNHASAGYATAINLNALSTTVANLKTTDVEEGTNKYFTDARARSAITGGASTIVGNDLTASRALISNANGKVAVSGVTSTELGYLDGVTSNIQTQLNDKAPSSLSTTVDNFINNTSVSKSTDGNTITVKINGTEQSLTNSWRGISDKTNGTSSDISASEKAVKSAYDLANTANTTANTAKTTADTVAGYFTSGVANSAAKLSTTSKTAWGQTYWTANGVPKSISGAMTDVSNITMTGYIKMGDATISYDSTQKCIKFSF